MSRSRSTMPEFLSTPSARRATTAQRRRKIEHGKFLSTPSARRATAAFSLAGTSSMISIHALREEGDS